jgi:hypothetical protein
VSLHLGDETVVGATRLLEGRAAAVIRVRPTARNPIAPSTPAPSCDQPNLAIGREPLSLTPTCVSAMDGVATISWTRGYDGSGCSVGSVGLGGGAVVEVDLVA